MTIEAQGHVYSMEYHGADRIMVTLTLEASRLDSHPHRVTIKATAAEVAHYAVGMPVIVQIRQNCSTAQTPGEPK